MHGSGDFAWGYLSRCVVGLSERGLRNTIGTITRQAAEARTQDPWVLVSQIQYRDVTVVGRTHLDGPARGSVLLPGRGSASAEWMAARRFTPAAPGVIGSAAEPPEKRGYFNRFSR